jgi:hypothetical protein
MGSQAEELTKRHEAPSQGTGTEPLSDGRLRFTSDAMRSAASQVSLEICQLVGTVIRIPCGMWPGRPINGMLLSTQESTPRQQPRGHGRTAGAGVARYAFTVRLSHPLLHAS